jgi:hypothetical protein
MLQCIAVVLYYCYWYECVIVNMLICSYPWNNGVGRPSDKGRDLNVCFWYIAHCLNARATRWCCCSSAFCAVAPTCCFIKTVELWNYCELYELCVLYHVVLTSRFELSSINECVCTLRYWTSPVHGQRSARENSLCSTRSRSPPHVQCLVTFEFTCDKQSVCVQGAFDYGLSHWFYGAHAVTYSLFVIR